MTTLPDLIKEAEPILQFMRGAAGNARMDKHLPAKDVARIREKVEQYIRVNEPDYQIPGYLDKWTIRAETDDSGFIYVHRILCADRSNTIHDHSRHVASLCLKGSASELVQIDGRGDLEAKNIGAGLMVYRDGNRLRHRLGEVEAPFMTLYVGGDKLRENFRTFTGDTFREVKSQDFWPEKVFQAVVNA